MGVEYLYAVFSAQWGRAAIMKYMGNLYHRMNTKELRTLRSKKVLMVNRDHEGARRLALSEVLTLKQQIIWIDAVLKAREDQSGLFS
jgi:hypothetical protein